eukprot:scaffold7439_cov168-Ochromonas_danica.AAC.6
MEVYCAWIGSKQAASAEQQLPILTHFDPGRKYQKKYLSTHKRKESNFQPPIQWLIIPDRGNKSGSWR